MNGKTAEFAILPLPPLTRPYCIALRSAQCIQVCTAHWDVVHCNTVTLHCTTQYTVHPSRMHWDAVHCTLQYNSPSSSPTELLSRVQCIWASQCNITQPYTAQRWFCALFWLGPTGSALYCIALCAVGWITVQWSLESALQFNLRCNSLLNTLHCTLMHWLH